MRADDNICYCYHVSLRKLYHFARREKLQRPSQMSDCLGAGTGCGWCIPILCKIHQRVEEGWQLDSDIPLEGLPDDAEAYAAARQNYIKFDKKNSFQDQ